MMWRSFTARVVAFELARHIRFEHAEPTGSPVWRLRKLRKLHKRLHDTDARQRHVHGDLFGSLMKWPELPPLGEREW